LATAGWRKTTGPSARGGGVAALLPSPAAAWPAAGRFVCFRSHRTGRVFPARPRQATGITKNARAEIPEIAFAPLGLLKSRPEGGGAPETLGRRRSSIERTVTHRTLAQRPQLASHSAQQAPSFPTACELFLREGGPPFTSRFSLLSLLPLPP